MSLKVTPGESLVIIGGSGTGKSVTLKRILGILRHDFGQILIDGVPFAGIDRAQVPPRLRHAVPGGALFD